MDSRVSIYLKRANNEFALANMLFNLSENNEKKLDLGLEKEESFYSAVISHCYYAIFYSVRAYLIYKKIELKSEQGQHQQVLYEFRKLARKEFIDTKILEIYEEMKERAEILLEILEKEKNKRTEFVYETIAQANIPPAKESINNSKVFIKTIKEAINIQER